MKSSASDEEIIQGLMHLLDSHDDQPEDLNDMHMVDLINRLLEHQKMVADLQEKLKSVQPRPCRAKSDMRRIVLVAHAGSDDHVSGNLKILQSKCTGPVHKLVSDCNHEEWFDWKGDVEQEDVMKSGVTFNFAKGETHTLDAKRVLRRLAEFAQDAAAVEAEGSNVSIDVTDIVHCRYILTRTPIGKIPPRNGIDHHHYKTQIGVSQQT